MSASTVTTGVSRPRRRRAPATKRRSNLLTVIVWITMIYFLVPLIWLFISTTKDNSDLFATFDALKEKRVVGVLRDFQERGHRRQQVGNDFLDDRYEGAAPREIHELFERCLLHKVCVGIRELLPAVCTGTADRAAVAKMPSGGRCPVQSSN